MADEKGDLREHVRKTFGGIATLQLYAHSGWAMVGAAILEESLKRGLLQKMRPLSANMLKRLFDGYGPLSTLSAKADLSFALEILPPEAHAKLKLIQKIRNVFAHSDDIINFGSPEIQALMLELGFSGPVADAPEFYFIKIIEIESHLPPLEEGAEGKGSDNT